MDDSDNGAVTNVFTGKMAEGSGTALYSTTDDKYVVKVLEESEYSMYELMWRDAAGLVTMSKSGITPELYFPGVPLSTEHSCISRMIVMDKVGSKTIKDLAVPYLVRGASVPHAIVRELGKAALKLIAAQVHERGIIHGDVHWQNFVFSDDNNIAGTIRIIDFGRSKPYMGKSEYQMRPVGAGEINWYEFWLSPGEIEGQPVSRADDLFRIADMLILLLEGADSFIVRERANHRGYISERPMTPAETARFKRNRVFKANTPLDIRQFYQYTLTLGFHDKPKYDGWFP
jgi:tRNA A-37 threonylcarbamoyl transferase component Bud32